MLSTEIVESATISINDSILIVMVRRNGLSLVHCYALGEFLIKYSAKVIISFKK